jgi:RNA polymerase sigma-70 factor (ECF subfamily)
MTFAQDQRAMAAEENFTVVPQSGVRAAFATYATSRNAPERVNLHSELSAEQLAGRCQAGCVDAFEQLVLRFEARVFNFLHQFTRNTHDAEDLTQVTFVKAYRSLPRYKPSLAFAPWLFTIARRTAASHFRSVERFEELPADGGIDETDPAGALAGKDEQAAIWRLARTLKPKLWEALWLRYGEDFSIREIACITRTSRIHVKVRLHRARSALARKLAAAGVHVPVRPAARIA